MPRSNRQLTQFAVDKLRQYLVYGPDLFVSEKAGNTEVYFNNCPTCPRMALEIKLFAKTILQLIPNPFNPRVIAGIGVFTGDFYDSKGRPSRTTRERLNGLLDALGTAGFIPEGVRVFLREDGTCCLGKGDACKCFDAGNNPVLILAHPNDLVFS